MTRIYVGGLPANVSEEELIALFETEGKVAKVEITRNEKTGLSQGFAFVEMENEELSREAVNALHGVKLHGGVVVMSLVQGATDKEILEDFE